MKQKDIDKLVKEARDGKNEAFGKLIIYYKDDLYRIVRARIGLSDDDICDIVQETILAMYSSINKLKEISSFKCVIYRRFEHIILHEFQKANLSLNVIALVDDAKTAILLAKTLNLHAIVPYGAYNTFKEGLYASSIIDSNLETSLCAVTRIGEEIEEPYKKFIEYLKN